MSASNFKITTHVLDTNKGLPVPDLQIKLYKWKRDDEWIFISEGKTENTGRAPVFAVNDTEPVPGTYKLHFLTKRYYDSTNAKTMYPFIDLVFDVEKSEHYHMPLLLNAFGFTTYRGS